MRKNISERWSHHFTHISYIWNICNEKSVALLPSFLASYHWCRWRVDKIRLDNIKARIPYYNSNPFIYSLRLRSLHRINLLNIMTLLCWYSNYFSFWCVFVLRESILATFGVNEKWEEAFHFYGYKHTTHYNYAKQEFIYKNSML